MCVQKSMLEMTEQLLFPVSWSTQCNPKSVILFSNKTYNFHFSGLLILLTYLKNKYIVNYIKATTNEIFPIFTTALLIRGAIYSVIRPC